MNIDYTMDKSQKSGRWSDFSLTMKEASHSEAFIGAPALRLRADVSGQSGMVPPRTGVYIPVDDPLGTPQFCWTGKPAGPLQECRTFNTLGQTAFSAIGPSDLWTNKGRMHAFVQDHVTDPALMKDSFFEDSVKDPELSASLVARQAFTSRSCEWIFVEQIHGESEDWSEKTIVEKTVSGPRVAAGERCPQEGYYFTPARADSRRYFAKAELMPHLGGDYGMTIWQWDTNQQ